MKSQKILVLLVILVLLGFGFFFYKNNSKSEIVNVLRNQEATTQLEGVYSYGLNGKPILEFSALNPKTGKPIFVANDDRLIDITFVNQNDALKKFGIDISKLPNDNNCDITGSFSVIEVTGYDSEKAEKTLMNEVTLKSVITSSMPKVQCSN